MSEASPLHQLVHTRLREAFGEPNSALGRKDHWSLAASTPGTVVNVLVDGTDTSPIIWVFDPHDSDDGVVRALIEREDQVEPVIQKIQNRVKRASQRPN